VSVILLNEPEGFPADALSRLRESGAVFTSSQTYPAGDVTAAFVRLREPVGRAFVEMHPRLRWVVSPTTGENHLDIPCLRDHGVNLITLKGRTDFLERIHATAEHTLALALGLMRGLPGAVASVLEGLWDRYPFKGRELFGKAVLIVGYGRVGRQVSDLYSAFGCKVIAHDRDRSKVPAHLWVELAAGLAAADIVSVHVSFETQSRNLLGAAELARMKRTGILVNTSRGEIIDQGAMLDALERHVISGAAVDVLIDEPDPLRPEIARRIRALGRRLLVTPHIGGFTEESLALVEREVVEIYLRESSAAR
jgi:D-3-phosphoglycerate dehydrogenase / 2-oxoglutarate reductase